jgi:hypothetical protein
MKCNELASIIGQVPALRLCAELAGHSVYVPCIMVLPEVRERVLELADMGLEPWKVARVAGLRIRQVRGIVRLADSWSNKARQSHLLGVGWQRF